MTDLSSVTPPVPHPGYALVISPRSGRVVHTYRLGNTMLGWYQDNGYIIWD